MTGNSGHVDTFIGATGETAVIEGTSWTNNTLEVSDNLSSLQNIQSIDLGYGSNQIIGADSNNHDWNFSGIALNTHETVMAGAGNDTITGGHGTMEVSVGAGTGSDTISGGEGSLHVILSGNSGNVDTFIGGAGGDNVIDGTSWSGNVLHASDTLSNLQNIQSIDLGYGSNSIVGGAGDNLNWNFSNISLNSHETIVGGSGNDSITLDTGHNIVTAGNGNDSIILNGGANTVSLGNGNDTVTDNLDANGDSLTLGNGNDTINLASSTGNDNITLGDGVNSLTLGASGTESLALTGSHGQDAITLGGGALNLNLTGTSGYNTISVSAETGAIGSDTIYLDTTGHDVITGAGTVNWTDTLDIANHTAPSLFLEVNGVWESTALTGHGTLTFGANETVSISTVSGDTNHAHDIVDFTHIEKLVY